MRASAAPKVGKSVLASTPPKAAVRAAELAAKAIDKRIDPAAPPEEREIRKRELIQGPSPFRGTRKDRPEK